MPLSNYESLSNEILSDLSPTQGQETTPSPASGQGGIDYTMPIRYRASGRDLEEPLETVIQRASRGYDYSQLVEKHKQRETTLGQRESQVNEFAKKWQPYIDYANQNPTWADHVRQSWESVAGAGQSPMATPQAQPQELSEIKAFIAQYTQERELARQQQEDSALAVQIDEIRREHPDVDFGYSDPATGETLEYKILKHGQTNGITSFRASFRDFYHDKLIEKAALKAKETVTQGIQARAKSGFVAESSSPLMGQQNMETPKRRNYFEAIMDGIKEISTN